MRAMRLAMAFLKDDVRMQKYNDAMSLLRSAGMETLLRRLGEPEAILLSQSNIAEMSAFAQAEARGWYDALDTLFYFEERTKAVGGVSALSGESDYGAEAALLNLGYTEEEIARARED